MPVAEAMARKLIPIVSERSVLEEVAGAGAITVSPDSVEEIARGMLMLTGLDEAERSQRIALFDRQIAQFSEEAFRRKWRMLLAA